MQFVYVLFMIPIEFKHVCFYNSITENSFDKLVADFQLALYRHYEEKKEPLYHPVLMRDFSEENAPGLFETLLQSILRDDDRLSKDDRSLQEQRTVVLLHTLAYFRLVVGLSLLTSMAL